MGRSKFTELSGQTFGRALAQAQLDHATLLRVLHYDPLTGNFTRLKATSNSAPPVGSIAGNKNKSGYWVVGVGGRQHYAHRLAWFYVHGHWPEHHIDHINGIKTDNRIANLRDVMHKVNVQNMRKAPRTSKSGVIGASPRPPRKGGFASYIRIDGRNVYLGCFVTEDAAHQAYVAAKRLHHEGCTL